jgi:hypothetical protein
MSRRYPRRPLDRNPRVRCDDPEPSIRDLLADPVLQLLMARDRVECAQLLQIVKGARARLGVLAHPQQAVAEEMLCAECGA